MKVKPIFVSRNVEIGDSSVERGTTVGFRQAENVNEMLELAGGDLAKALEFFNEGRWAPIRTQTSNALAGKSNEQKAVDKMVAAFKTMNPTLTDEAARTLVLNLPGMEAASKVNADILPKEIPDTYFVKTPKAEETAA